MSQRNGLSDDAKVLLLWAADEGTINCSTVTLGPRKVITGGRNFIKDSSPRSREQWLAAVKELVHRQGDMAGYQNPRLPVAITLAMPRKGHIAWRSNLTLSD